MASKSAAHREVVLRPYGSVPERMSSTERSISPRLTRPTSISPRGMSKRTCVGQHSGQDKLMQISLCRVTVTNA
jgi:hypothetical protein